MSTILTCDKCGDPVIRHGVDALAAAVAANITPSICKVRGCGGMYREMVMADAKAEAIGNAMQGILLLPPGTNINAIEPSLAERAERWMHSPGGRHVMRDLYALAAKYARDWRRTGIPISMKLLYELERHRIKCVTARALRRGFKIKDEYGYTLNNSYTAYIARHIMDRREDWDGLFETRRLKDDHE